MYERDEFLRDRIRPHQPGTPRGYSPRPPSGDRCPAPPPGRHAAAATPPGPPRLPSAPLRPLPDPAWPRQPEVPPPSTWADPALAPIRSRTRPGERGWRRMVRLVTFGLVGLGRSGMQRQEAHGHRPKTVSTTAGDIEVQIPKLRAGSFFPSLLERRRRIDKALHAVIMEAYVHGVSTRSVDDLVAAMGVQAGVSKSEVSRICAGLDTEIEAFRTRSLTHTEFPYVFCDATFCKVRVGAHVVSQALVVATGVSIDGTREVLGTAVGDSESYEFWREFLASLKARGLTGVHLVISDAHAGLKAAVAQQFSGASWQRCRVHFMRNLYTAVAAKHAPAVTVAVKTIFAHTDPEEVGAQWDRVADPLCQP